MWEYCQIQLGLGVALGKSPLFGVALLLFYWFLPPKKVINFVEGREF